jgi:hypothetical protein
MKTDPVVDEVRAIRERLAAKFNFDLEAIVADAQQREIIHGDRLVNLRAKQDREAKDKAA